MPGELIGGKEEIHVYMWGRGVVEIMPGELIGGKEEIHVYMCVCRHLVAATGVSSAIWSKRILQYYYFVVVSTSRKKNPPAALFFGDKLNDDSGSVLHLPIFTDSPANPFCVWVLFTK